MSHEAITWVLQDAPGVPSQCVAVLIGLAERADKHGHNAYPSAATLSAWARKSERQVRYDLSLLSDAKLIRLGDQSKAAKYAANRRPVVYDLAMERSQATEGVQPIAPQETDVSGVQSASGVHSTAPRQSTAPQSADDLQEHDGVQSAAPQDGERLGCNAAQPGVQPTAYKPPVKPKISPTERSTTGAKSDLASLFDADPVTKPKRGRRPKPTADPLFDAWYAAYPLHKSRGEAEKAWAEVMADGEDPQVLTVAAKAYHDDPQVRRGFPKHPATWLRAKCWLDEPAPPPTIAPEQNGRTPKQVNFSDEEHRRGFSRRSSA